MPDEFVRAMTNPAANVRYEECVLGRRTDVEIEEERVGLLRTMVAARIEPRSFHRRWSDLRSHVVRLVDRPSFARLFEPSPAAPKPLEVAFPAGVHEWKAVGEIRRTRRGAVIRGAGMDRTLVRVRAAVKAKGLAYRDLTVDLRSGRMLVDPDGVSLRLERCRVIGFSRDHALRLSEGILLATECRFEVAYDRRPDRGGLARLEREVVARFEGCLVSLGPAGGSLVAKVRGPTAFSRCRLLDLSERERALVETGSRDVSLEGCEIEWVEPRKVGKPDPRPLSDINPAWGRGYARNR
jgi:hypothetical protein